MDAAPRALFLPNPPTARQGAGAPASAGGVPLGGSLIWPGGPPSGDVPVMAPPGGRPAGGVPLGNPRSGDTPSGGVPLGRNPFWAPSCPVAFEAMPASPPADLVVWLVVQPAVNERQPRTRAVARTSRSRRERRRPCEVSLFTNIISWCSSRKAGNRDSWWPVLRERCTHPIEPIGEIAPGIRSHLLFRFRGYRSSDGLGGEGSTRCLPLSECQRNL